MIIGFCGKKGSGKNFYANYLINNYNFKELSFAYPLKESLKLILNLNDSDVNGINKDKFNNKYQCYNRELLQWFGTDVFRESFNNRFNYNGSVWVDWIKDIIIKNPDNYVITDVRFQNEIDMLHSFNGKIINIVADYDTNDLTYNHKSENQILKYDYEIINLKNTLNTKQNYKIIDNIINNLK